MTTPGRVLTSLRGATLDEMTERHFRSFAEDRAEMEELEEQIRQREQAHEESDSDPPADEEGP